MFRNLPTHQRRGSQVNSSESSVQAGAGERGGLLTQHQRPSLTLCQLPRGYTMNWLKMSESEILAIASPIMDNLMQASTDIDHERHVRDFTES